MRKKYNTLSEEMNRMKSLFTEERLYGNLVDKPLLTEANFARFIDNAFLRNSGKLFKQVDTKTGRMIERAVQKEIRSFDDFRLHLEEFGTIWKMMMTPQEYVQGLAHITYLSKMEKAGRFAENSVRRPDGVFEKLNIYEPLTPGGRAYIDLIPEGGGLRSLAMIKFFDETDIGPLTKIKNAKGEEVVVHRAFDPESNQVSLIDTDSNGNLTLLDGKGKKEPLLDGDGNPIKGNTIKNTTDVEYVEVFTKEELANQLDNQANNTIGEGGVQVLGDGNVVHINIGQTPVKEVVDETIKTTSEAIAKKTGIAGGWQKVKKVLKYVGVDNQILATIFNPYVIGGVKKSGLMKKRGTVFGVRMTLHYLGYYFFIHKLCDASNSEEGGEDPEPYNLMNLYNEEDWIFSPCFYPLWPVRLITDWSWITGRLNKSQKNFCRKFDTDENGKRTKSEECAGFFQKIDNALKGVDDKNNSVWCEKYKGKSSEEVFSAQIEEALDLMDTEEVTAGKEKTIGDIMGNLGFNTDKALEKFKASPSWEEFDLRCSANQIQCDPLEFDNNGKSNEVEYIPREGSDGKTEYVVSKNDTTELDDL